MAKQLKLHGLDEWVKTLRKNADKVPDAIQRTLETNASLILTDATMAAPEHTGKLVDSGYIDPIEKDELFTRIELGFRENEYAAYVEEGTPKGESKRRKFLGNAVKRRRNKVRKEIQADLDELVERINREPK